MSVRQLPLPFPEPSLPTYARGVPRDARVYVNRNLRLTGTDYVGFDMDYTLAIYRQEAMDRLSIDATVAKLVEKEYPAYLKETPYDTAFAIRGLLIDKKLGHVLKLDRYKAVSRGYHGMRELPREEILRTYHERKVRPTAPRFHWIDTLYALSEAAVYAGVVEAMEARGDEPSFETLFVDIRAAIDEAHRDGTILDTVLADLARFVVKDEKLATTLHKFRSAGKRLFLLTNSGPAYSERMMSYLLDGAMGEYPSWRHYFDVVITAAQKPDFFTGTRPFLEREGGEQRPALGHLQRGRLYEGGNLRELEKRLGVTGDRVVYVGDHIFGDILRSKKDSAWRTAMIIQELEAELAAHDACAGDLQRLDVLTTARNGLEDELRDVQLRLKEILRAQETEADARAKASLEGDRLRTKKMVDRIRAEMRAIERETLGIEARVDRRFHPYFGSLLKEGVEQSSFGDQVEEYACLYTSRVSNFLHYSPAQFFRSPRDLMPHEL